MTNGEDRPRDIHDDILIYILYSVDVKCAAQTCVKEFYIAKEFEGVLEDDNQRGREEKASELEKEWKDFPLEHEMYVKKVELIHKQNEEDVDVISSSAAKQMQNFLFVMHLTR